MSTTPRVTSCQKLETLSSVKPLPAFRGSAPRAAFPIRCPARRERGAAENDRGDHGEQILPAALGPPRPSMAPARCRRRRPGERRHDIERHDGAIDRDTDQARCLGIAARCIDIAAELVWAARARSRGRSRSSAISGIGTPHSRPTPIQLKPSTISGLGEAAGQHQGDARDDRHRAERDDQWIQAQPRGQEAVEERRSPQRSRRRMPAAPQISTPAAIK